MLSKNAITVLEKRYLLKDEGGNLCETSEGLFKRVAVALAEPDRAYGATDAQVEATAQAFYDLTYNLDFLPNSPTLANAGTRTGQLSACFVLPVPDDLAGIFETAKHAALIHQTGGGTGFAFSRLRPKNDIVNSTKGVSSGPVSFMDVYNAATESIKQGGMRRGANMGILRIDHPDIMDFIVHKEDLSKLTNFNISVAVTNAFMDAVEAGSEYALLNPRDGREVGRLDARKVFKDIVQRAWSTGEPGLVFIDRMNEYCPVPWMGQYEATNPCVTADTWVHTDEGPRQVSDLIGRAFVARVDGVDHATGLNGFFKTATKEVVRLRTASGYSLRLTADHRVKRVTKQTRYRLESEWCAAGDLRPGDKVVLNNHRGNVHWAGPRTAEEGYLLGMLVGDGTLKMDKAVLSVWKPAMAVNGGATGADAVMGAALKAAMTLPHRADFQGWVSVAGRNEYRLSTAALTQLAAEVGMDGRKTITPEMERASSEFQRAFLRGFFDTDGTVIGTHEKGVSVRLAQSDLARLEAAQRMLLRFGIVSQIYQNRRAEGVRMLPDGKGGMAEYPTKAQHELCISGESIVAFRDHIGFEDTDKAFRLETAIRSFRRAVNRDRFVAEVVGIEADGVEDVYDVQVPGVNAFDANGIVAHNCGEQPLIPYESCNLGSVNLERFVIDVNGTPSIDWKRLREVVHVSTHLLDNVIDANKYPIPEIERVTKATRKIGLGVMGFARMLFKLGVGYGSEESFRLAEQVFSFIDFESKVKSIELSKTRGQFSGRDGHEAESNAFFTKLLAERAKKVHRHPEADFASLIPLVEAHGIRNSTTTTIAPTGTLSIIADTSGGCEPVFALAFKRWQADTHMVDVDSVFEQYAKDHGFYSAALMEAVDANHGTLEGLTGHDVPEEAVRIFRTAHDISPSEHVLLQAAFQAYNDSATSKTINFAEHATVEDVETAYLLAWQTGCKGITVYRNNSRQFQPLSVSKKETPKVEATAPVAAPAAPAPRTRPRPEDLYGFTRTIHTGDGKLYTTVNYDEFGIREVVTNIGRSGGTLNSLSEAIGRLISLALQYNVPNDEISRSLIGIRGANPYGFGANQVLSIPDAIGKVLKDAPRQLGQVLAAQPSVVDALSPVAANRKSERSGSDAVLIYGESPECPECNHALEFGEGCMTCRGCGYSKCS